MTTTYTQLELPLGYPTAIGWDDPHLRENLRLYATRFAALAAVVVSALATAWDRIVWPLIATGFATTIRWLDQELSARLLAGAERTQLQPHPISHPAPAPVEALYPVTRDRLLKLTRAQLKTAAGTRRNVNKAALVDMIMAQQGDRSYVTSNCSFDYWQ